MTRYYCDRCGFEMTQKKYREGYRLPDPNPKYNAWMMRSLRIPLQS
jgi:hypothetical protein